MIFNPCGFNSDEKNGVVARIQIFGTNIYPCMVWFDLLLKTPGLYLVPELRYPWFGLVWFGMVWYGLVWYGLVWFGMAWFGLV